MTRVGRRKTGGSGPGLFRWGPHGEQPAEVEDNPLLRPCPFCGASARQPCRRPARGGTAELVGRFHDSRTASALVDQQHPETGPQTPTEPRKAPPA